MTKATVRQLHHLNSRGFPAHGSSPERYHAAVSSCLHENLPKPLTQIAEVRKVAMLCSDPGFLSFFTSRLYMQSRSHTYTSASIDPRIRTAHIRPTVPAVKDNFEALGRLDRDDVDIPDPVPQRPARARVVPVEPNAGEDTRPLHVSLGRRRYLSRRTSDKLHTA